MKQLHKREIDASYSKNLQSYCEDCCGICCRALCFSIIDGFPYDKPEKTSCRYLADNYACKIHSSLYEKGYTGCCTFECLGAGNITTQLCLTHDVEDEHIMYNIFTTLSQIQLMYSYLAEAMSITKNVQLYTKLYDQLNAVDANRSSLKKLNQIHINELYDKVNPLLKLVWQEVQHTYRFASYQRDQHYKHLIIAEDFSMRICIQKDLSYSELKGCCMLGCDLRDANVRNADLRDTLYLTQMQINSMNGNKYTLLPPNKRYPMHWT